MIKKMFHFIRQNFRKKRYRKIQELTSVDLISGAILDLGGGPASFFAEQFSQMEKVILIDIEYSKIHNAKQKMPQLKAIVADAGYLPFACDSIAMTVCNSVIEHVENPVRMAAEINRVSCGCFLQTPNGKFPVETHSYIGIPFYHSIPFIKIQQIVCKLFGANYNYIESVRYLSEDRLRMLFPKANISYEHFFGLKKSFYLSWVDRRSE